MSKPTANLRLFVAAYPPAEAALAMRDAARELRLPPGRFTPPEQLHLTLLFIGDTPSAHLDDVKESIARAASGIPSLTLTPQRLITLPESNRIPARLIALESDAPPPLLELQRRLVTRLAQGGTRESSNRFRPHFTLLRFSSPTAGLHIDQAIILPPFTINWIALMRSTLAPTGATHHEILRIALS